MDCATYDRITRDSVEAVVSAISSDNPIDRLEALIGDPLTQDEYAALVGWLAGRAYTLQRFHAQSLLRTKAWLDAQPRLRFVKRYWPENAY